MTTFDEQSWERKKRIGYPEDVQTEGLHRGGEKMVETILGGNRILPFEIEDIIREGIKSLSNHIKDLKTASEVEAEILKALEAKKGFSLIRIGDGELTTMAHDIILSSKEILSNPRLNFLPYAGVVLPDHQSRNLLAKNIMEADIVGIPSLRWPTFQLLFIKLAKYYKWPLKRMILTQSVINYELHLQTNLFNNLLTKNKVLLIGNRMKEGEKLLKNSGYDNIVGSIPVENIKSVSSVLEEAEKYDYDIALVSAGISANLICVELAKKNKIAIDFGHLIDELIMGTKVISNK